MASLLGKCLNAAADDDSVLYCPRSTRLAAALVSRIQLIAERHGWWLADYGNADHGPWFMLRHR